MVRATDHHTQTILVLPGLDSPPDCDKTHLTYYSLARCVWPRALWIWDEGPYASVAHCAPGTTVILWPTFDQARRALDRIAYLGCGHACDETNHELIIFGKVAAA